MRIRVSDIKSSGLKINDTISLPALNARMSEGGREADIIFLDAPVVEMTVRKTHGGAETKGRAKTRYKQACSLCLEGVEREIEVDTNFDFSYPTRTSQHQRDEGDTSITDDMEIYTIKNDHIEVEELIQENFILSLSVYWHPPIEPNGSCSVCKVKPGLFGKETSDTATQSLGTLLQQAQKKSD